jgi:hypothetical protein
MTARDAAAMAYWLLLEGTAKPMRINMGNIVKT